MNILEEYKKQASKLRQDIEQSSGQGVEMGLIRSMHVVTGLQKIHAYLHELIEQLNFIEPDIRCDIPLEDFGDLTNLRQGDYKLLYESSYNKESVNLYYALNNEDQLHIEIDENEKTKQRIDRLKNQGLLVSYVSRQPPKVSIQGYIPVHLEFLSNFDDSCIQIALHNFRGLEDADYKLNVDDIGDEELNELAALILREPSKFMDLLAEDSQSISLIKNRNLNPNNEGGPQTEEMDASRLRSMFNREHRLYLTYHNTIKDVGTRTQGFIMGRAKDCDLAINSDLASRHHAQLVYRKGKFVLVDQSTNGTFVKTQGGKEVYVQSEALPLSGSGFISLGKAVSVDNEHLIYYSCQ